MATAKTIKWKDGTLKDILLMKYKHENSIETINSVYLVRQGARTKIWPTEYSATLVCEGANNTSLPKQIGAVGGSVNLKWYLTLKYPDTNEFVTYNGTTYNHLDVTSRITHSNNLVGYHNNYDNSYNVDSSQTNPATVTVPNRSRNGAASYGSNPPVSNGGWQYWVCGELEIVVNGITVIVSNGSTTVIEQDGNNFWQVTDIPANPYYSNLSLAYHNNEYLTDQNSSSNRASYSGTTVYPEVSSVCHYIYEFTSGARYDHRVTDNRPSFSTWEIVDASNHTWATINTDNGRVTLAENTNTSGRSVQAKLTVNYDQNAGSLTKTCTIYQAGKPSSS